MNHGDYYGRVVRWSVGDRATCFGPADATAEVPAPPERVFRALITNEVERWWATPISTAQSDGGHLGVAMRTR